MKAVLVVIMLMIAVPLAAATLSGEIATSQDQLFWVNGSWVPAEGLRPGDEFTTPDGRRAVVRNVATVDLTENVSCHGLLTDHPHDFFANKALTRDGSRLSTDSPVTISDHRAQTRPSGFLSAVLDAWREFLQSLHGIAAQDQ